MFTQHVPEIVISAEQHRAPPEVKSSVNKHTLGSASLTAIENRRSWSGSMDSLAVKPISRGLTEGLSPGPIPMPAQDVPSIPQASDDDWDVNEHTSSNFEITIRAPTPVTEGRSICSELERELFPEGDNTIELIYAIPVQARINVSADEADHVPADELGDLPTIPAVSPQDKPSPTLHSDFPISTQDALAPVLGANPNALV